MIIFFYRLLSTKFLSDDNALPKTCQEARKTLSSLGMEYNAYPACPNDCLLFTNEYENDVVCSKCGEHRYKEDMIGKTIPRKVL